MLKLGHSAETGTYQAMIHPLVPYALRGFLWYQGESNNGEGMLYTPKKQALIEGWRKQFRRRTPRSSSCNSPPTTTVRNAQSTSRASGGRSRRP